MKKYFLMVVCAMAMSVGTAGLTACGSDEDGTEVVETPVSKAQEILETVKFTAGYYLSSASSPCLDSDWFKAPDGKIIQVLVQAENCPDGCAVEITLKESNSKNWAKFYRQICKNGSVDIVDTGEKNDLGQTIKNVTIRIPEIKDETGAVAKNITLRYRGTVEKLGMLGY